MKAQIIAALLFLILGIVFACGKGTFLIAGYNTLPEENKARYDARKILRDMSRMMFSCVGCMAVGILGSIVDAPWLVVLGVVLTVLVIVFFLIRINRESKRSRLPHKKSPLRLSLRQARGFLHARAAGFLLTSA